MYSNAVVFGKNAQNQIGSELKKRGVKRVLIHHDNGEFLYATGLLESISRNLEKEGISWVELGGVLPNPRLSLVYEGIEIAKKEDVDFVIAIGGGSVIDSAKAIGLGAVIKGDVWDFFYRSCSSGILSSCWRNPDLSCYGKRIQRCYSCK